MTSLWLDRVARAPEDADTFPAPHLRAGAPPFPAPDFEPGAHYDDVVVGAGISGLITALLLARSGRRVAVLEALHVGAVTTGNTTGKVSLLQGAKYREMLKYTSKRVARAYIEGNREGLEWLVRYLDEHSVPYQRRDAYTYAGTPE